MKSASAASPTDLANQFHALSEDTRLRIVDLLGEGEHCVCELTEALEISQPLLSFHLKVLKEAGLVRDRKQGRWAYYCLESQPLNTVAGFLAGLTRQARRRSKNPRCCE
jgi:ArsR family transcriptional regulator